MFAVKRYVRGSTPVARPCHRRHLGRRRTLKVISQPRFWSTWRSAVLPCHLAIAAKPERSDWCLRILGIERRFEKPRTGRGPSSLKPLVVVCRKI
jgi:hypothetical protein